MAPVADIEAIKWNTDYLNAIRPALLVLKTSRVVLIWGDTYGDLYKGKRIVRSDDSYNYIDSYKCIERKKDRLPRACGPENLSGFRHSDITTWKRDIAGLSGVRFAGVFSWIATAYRQCFLNRCGRI